MEVRKIITLTITLEVNFKQFNKQKIITDHQRKTQIFLHSSDFEDLKKDRPPSTYLAKLKKKKTIT